MPSPAIKPHDVVEGEQHLTVIPAGLKREGVLMRKEAFLPP